MNIQTIGFVIVFGYFLFQVWYAIHTRNIGKFNRTSQIVWGSVGFLLLLLLGFVYYMSHTGA